MSHEIHIVAGIDDPINEERLIAGLLAARWQAPSDTAGLTFANPDTGVQASIEPLHAPSLPVGYRSLDLGLVLPYVRPSWFALETVPGFADAVSAAGLLVFDPQADSPAPVPPDPDALIASWASRNEAAVGAARAAGASLLGLEADRSMAWWRHQVALPRLKLGFAAELYVPSLRLVRRSGSDRVDRAMSWPDHVPTLFPECDLVIMLRSDPVKRFVITGVTSAPTVHDRLESVTEQIEVEIPDPRVMRVLRPDKHADARERLESVVLEPFLGFEAVLPDAIVDIPPPA